MAPTPALEQARQRRAAYRHAIATLRTWREHGGSYPVLTYGPFAGDRLVALASHILTGRCQLTGEDPETVLAELEAGI